MEENTAQEYPFDRLNFKILLIGVGIVILGYLLMIGGGSEDPTVFNEEIFSHRRITVAPIVSLIGYVVIMYGIMKKPERLKDSQTS